MTKWHILSSFNRESGKLSTSTNIMGILDLLTIPFLKEGELYLQEGAETRDRPAALGLVRIAEGTTACTALKSLF